MSLIIGLTGGIGSGKSTAAEMFANLGIGTVDTDVIAHQLTAAGQPALTTMTELFGKGIITADGMLDRIKLRHLVFNDHAARKTLEDFLHPLIREQVLTILTQPSSSPYRIVVVPLLFETNAYRQIIQRSLVIDCPEELQLKRALTRGAINEQEVRGIMAVQCPRQQRLANADDVIVNDDGYEKLKQEVERFHEKYLSLA
ncbi:MAG TPA: dephospho-CoA kinase [Methylophilaceae bacterium]|jgi:dephospho-CoA kinase